MSPMRLPGIPLPAAEPLYHYCGVESFFGILRSKTLRLSDCRFMNDYAEQRWLLDKAHRKLCETVPDNDVQVSGILRDSCQILDWCPYLFCFSDDGGDRLSQWRAYSDDGRGFALGLSPDELQKLVTSVGDLPCITLRKVEYSEEIQDNKVDEIIRDFHERIKKCDPASHTEFLRRTFVQLLFLSMECKNPGFVEEREWRLCLLTGLTRKGEVPSNGSCGGVSEVCFRVRDGRLVPYFEVSFDASMIKRVYLGPKNKVRMDVLEWFLTKHGYDINRIEIKRAAATYH